MEGKSVEVGVDVRVDVNARTLAGSCLAKAAFVVDLIDFVLGFTENSLVAFLVDLRVGAVSFPSRALDRDRVRSMSSALTVSPTLPGEARRDAVFLGGADSEPDR